MGRRRVCLALPHVQAALSLCFKLMFFMIFVFIFIFLIFPCSKHPIERLLRVIRANTDVTAAPVKHCKRGSAEASFRLRPDGKSKCTYLVRGRYRV